MKICMTVSNPFVFDHRVSLEAQTLRDAGYQLCVVAWDREGKYPIDEVTDGIQIHRIRNSVWTNLLRKKPLQLFVFWIRAIKWMQKQNFDAVHCHDLDTLQIGLRLKKRQRIKLVYDAHEIYISMIQRDLTRLLTPFYKKLEREAAALVDHLIVAEDTYIPYFEKTGYSNISTVLNTKPLISTAYVPSKNPVFTLAYIGTLSRPRFLLELVEVSQEIKNIKLIIAGIGPIAGSWKPDASRWRTSIF